MSLLRVIPLIAIISVSILAITGYYYDQEQIKKISIPEMYFRADDLESGQYPRYDKALDIYTKIIEIDRTEENAWHEKGRLLNHLERCSESLLHYVEYIKVFPNSNRANEGYGIAKECNQKVEID